jgi:hypothetical protein
MTWMAMSKLEGFPLGALQVFAPIRLGNVPDCPWNHRSLVCPPSVSPSEEGSSSSGELFDRKQVNILEVRLCLAVLSRKCLFSAVACREQL